MASASTSAIVDITTVLSNGPTAATKVLAIAASGAIQDYVGNCEILQTKLKNAAQLLTMVLLVTDGSDGQLSNLQGCLAALKGTSSPNATLVTTMKAVVLAGPSSASKALAIAAAGPINDYPGNTGLLLTMFEEAYRLSTLIIAGTDGSDGSLGTLQSIQQLLT